MEGAHAGEVLTEEAVGKLREAQARSNRTSGRLMRRGYRQEEYVESRLKFGSSESGKTAAKEAAQKAEAETARKKNISRFCQKKRIKKSIVPQRQVEWSLQAKEQSQLVELLPRPSQKRENESQRKSCSGTNRFCSLLECLVSYLL